MIPVAIICGGLGTRLGELTARTPKSLVEVHGKPFIHHQLKLLREQGASRIVLCAGHLSEQLCAAHLPGVVFSFDGAFKLGTGGAIKKALPLLGDEFFTLYGDSYLPIDYEPIHQKMKRENAFGCLSLWQGVDYGINAFRKEAFDGFDGNFPLQAVVNKLQHENKLATYDVGQRFYEIGSPEGLAEVKTLLK